MGGTSSKPKVPEIKEVINPDGTTHYQTYVNGREIITSSKMELQKAVQSYYAEKKKANNLKRSMQQAKATKRNMQQTNTAAKKTFWQRHKNASSKFHSAVKPGVNTALSAGKTAGKAAWWGAKKTAKLAGQGASVLGRGAYSAASSGAKLAGQGASALGRGVYSAASYGSKSAKNYMTRKTTNSTNNGLNRYQKKLANRNNAVNVPGKNPFNTTTKNMNPFKNQPPASSNSSLNSYQKRLGSGVNAQPKNFETNPFA
jgi:hypothetical protein